MTNQKQRVSKNLLDFIREVNGNGFYMWNSGSGGRSDFGNPSSDFKPCEDSCKFTGKDKLLFLN